MIQTLLLATLLSFPQKPDDRMEMTDKQILQLGGVEFVNKFSDKFGSSTAAMVDGWEAYGAAIRRLNDAGFKNKPAATQQVVKTLRTRMADFRNEMCDVGRAFSGGGTIWNITYSETPADVEDALTFWSGVVKKTPKKRVVSDVTKWMAKVEKIAKDNAKGIDSVKASGGGMAELNSSLKIAKRQYAEIVKIAAKRSRRESDALLGFCFDAANIPTNQFGGDDGTTGGGR